MPNGHHDTEARVLTGAELAAAARDLLTDWGVRPVLDDQTRADAEFAAGLLLAALRVGSGPVEPRVAESLRRIAESGQQHRALAALRTVELST